MATQETSSRPARGTLRVGVDVGGTFTDLVLEDNRTGQERVLVHKVSSTVHDQSIGVVKGITELCAQAGVAPSELDMVFHGTTVATNMVIERDGADVGMITTRGFRDILHMARHKRPHNFSLQFDLPWQSSPLVRRRNRLVVDERIMPPTGEIAVPLSEDQVREAARTLKERDIRSVVVAFLFSFLNDSHERRAKEIVQEEMPEAFVTTSSEVVNMMREYERFSTAAMNAYIGPRTSGYLRNLQDRLHEAGIDCPVRIMQSNGGISTIENSSQRPVGLLLSGPAGGVIGGRCTAIACDTPDVITIDIGGTSADISVVQNARLSIKNPRDTQVADLPVLVPMLDVDAIGAGGGSIAYIDAGGAFRVGPRSAGAFPGPACYGLGGQEPTVTDAQVVLGRLDPEQFLGGALSINADLARKSVEEKIARPLGLSIENAALGILRIINNTMALAVNANSVSKGIDPRNFALMTFGGAGPLHGTSIATIIGAKRVISPLYPGITAAVGLLEAELQYEFTRSAPFVIDTASAGEIALVDGLFNDLIAEGNAQLELDNIAPDKRSFDRIIECRYIGQGFELRAEVPDGPLSTDLLTAVSKNFFEVHKQTYGHAFEDQQVQAVTLRVLAKGATHTLKLPEIAKGGKTNPATALLYSRSTVFDDGKAHDTPRYQRDRLLADDVVTGPAIITQNNSTTIIPPGTRAKVLSHGDIIINWEGN